jgi:ubiquitin-protein ligase
MSKVLFKRINNELNELKNNPIENCSAVPLDTDLTHWRATIFGPEDTPYHNGVFELDIKFTSEYPFKSPNVYFITPIFHCNINANGNINSSAISRIGGDWLRINNDDQSPGQTALYGNLSINDTRNGKSGLTVGSWESAGQGNIKATNNIIAGKQICIGGMCLNEDSLK